MLHIAVNFGDIRRLELGFLYLGFSGVFFAEEIWAGFQKSSGNTEHSAEPVCSRRVLVR